MSKDPESAPFATLGDKLKLLRQQQKESLAEAAGAVEIAEEELSRIEQGVERPAEEILMLLINHFGMHEDEAVHLWELAGYDQDDALEDKENTNLGKTIVMTIAMDPRVMYSDSVHIAGNQHGVILTFLQPGGGQSQQLPISRIGMSRDQVRKMMTVLEDTLNQLDKHQPPQKRLPDPSDDSKDAKDQQ